MAEKSPRGGHGKSAGEQMTLTISTEARPSFDQPLTGYVFDAAGNLRQRARVENGRLTLDLDPEEAGHDRIFIAPSDADLDDGDVSPARLERLGAHEAILRPGGKLIDVVRIPGGIIDLWPLCFTTVKGRVVRSADGRPVCNARVHVCEVDRIPLVISRLPDFDVLRLRDDLVAELRKTVVPRPWPKDPFPEPGPGPVPDIRPLFRVQASPEHDQAFEAAEKAASASMLQIDHRLLSSTSTVVRAALAENWRVLLPYLCYWPWHWGWFRCDEVAVVDTDPNGRFQVTIPYLCSGDQPDLYFWVEYDFGGGFETVHRPPVACSTHWNLPSGSEVTIRVSDERVPGCNDEPDLPGKQVWVMSIGRTVSIGEIHTSGTDEGTVSEGSEDYAFGGKLEPRVWFSRNSLIASGITHYLWSQRKVGTTTWTPLTRQVIRHYTDSASGTAPIDVMGPEPGGGNAGRFRIRPTAVPSGNADDEWVVLDEREDLASAHFVTSAPPVSPAPADHCGTADPDAGKYELKLELFDSAGNLVDMDAQNISLRYATSEAPFGAGTVDTVAAGDYHRIRAGGNTVAFRMVLHVDNSRCGAEISPISGSDITVDPACGIVTVDDPGATVDIGFAAGRPGGLARFSFGTRLGLSTPVPGASTSGMVSAAGTAAHSGLPDTFTRSAGCAFTRTGIAATAMLGGCPQGAFAETLYVSALTVDGYSRLSGLDATDVAAFMLTEPCPSHSHGHGHGQGGS